MKKRSVVCVLLALCSNLCLAETIYKMDEILCNPQDFSCVDMDGNNLSGTAQMFSKTGELVQEIKFENGKKMGEPIYYENGKPVAFDDEMIRKKYNDIRDAKNSYLLDLSVGTLQNAILHNVHYDNIPFPEISNQGLAEYFNKQIKGSLEGNTITETAQGENITYSFFGKSDCTKIGECYVIVDVNAGELPNKIWDVDNQDADQFKIPLIRYSSFAKQLHVVNLLESAKNDQTTPIMQDGIAYIKTIDGLLHRCDDSGAIFTLTKEECDKCPHRHMSYDGYCTSCKIDDDLKYETEYLQKIRNILLPEIRQYMKRSAEAKIIKLDKSTVYSGSITIGADGSLSGGMGYKDKESYAHLAPSVLRFYEPFPEKLYKHYNELKFDILYTKDLQEVQYSCHQTRYDDIREQQADCERAVNYVFENGICKKQSTMTQEARHQQKEAGEMRIATFSNGLADCETKNNLVTTPEECAKCPHRRMINGSCRYYKLDDILEKETDYLKQVEDVVLQFMFVPKDVKQDRRYVAFFDLMPDGTTNGIGYEGDAHFFSKQWFEKKNIRFPEFPQILNENYYQVRFQFICEEGKCALEYAEHQAHKKDSEEVRRKKCESVEGSIFRNGKCEVSPLMQQPKKKITIDGVSYDCNESFGRLQVDEETCSQCPNRAVNTIEFTTRTEKYCKIKYCLGGEMQNGDFPNASCVECDRNFPLLVSADECAKCPNREMDKQGYCQLKKDYKSDLRKECEEAGRKYVDGKCLPSEKEQQPKKQVIFEGKTYDCNKPYLDELWSSEIDRPKALCNLCENTAFKGNNRCVILYCLGKEMYRPLWNGYVGGECIPCDAPELKPLSQNECDKCPNREMYNGWCYLSTEVQKIKARTNGKTEQKKKNKRKTKK